MEQFETNATLTARRDVTSELAIVRVRPDNSNIAFLPGQYAELAIIEDHSAEGPDGATRNKLVRKAYSIASSPEDPEGLEFYIALVAQGELTPKLWRLNPGDRLWINPNIKGKFTLDTVAPEQNLVLAATGTGIAPFVSMLRTHLESPPWRRLAVFHGVRYPRDLGYQEELQSLELLHEHLRYIPVVSREDQNGAWGGMRGRLQAVFEPDVFPRLAGFPLDPEKTQIMLCGNPEMISDMEQLLVSLGHRLHKKRIPGNIHFERYW